MPIPSGAGRVLTTEELRRSKPDRRNFAQRPRSPVRLVLDGVRQNYNIGAIFRLCDALLVERLVISGITVELRKRKLVQAARGTENWVPWEAVVSAREAVAAARQAGFLIAAAELTSASVLPEELPAGRSICLVLGGERAGIAQEIVDLADCAVAIPMSGMANSLNVATAAAILVYHAVRRASTRPNLTHS